MIMQKSLDDKYLSCRKGVVFYYFGCGCIADYFSNSIAFLDEIDIFMINAGCSNNTIFNVKRKARKVFGISDDVFLKRIERLRKNGVIVFSETPIFNHLYYYGEKGKFYPKEIALELSSKCNYFCPFCYKNANINGIYMSDEIIRKIDKIIHNKVNNILLTGGEPTLHPNLMKFIDTFSEYANVSMITNGSILFNLNPNGLRKLSQIQFSIYGCNNNEYKNLTGCGDGFTRLCKSIEFAKNNDIDTKISMTICDKTYDHIESFVETSISLGVNTLRIGIADIFGRGRYLYSDNSVFFEKRNEILDKVSNLKCIYGDKIKIEIPNINYSHVNRHEDIVNCVYRGSLKCGCGSEYLVISETGRVRPCQMLPSELFSFESDNSLSEHINGDFHIESLKKCIRDYYSMNMLSIKNFSPCDSLDTIATNEGFIK